ncbi:MAG: prepilin-type N-terminal cleavage/methylation domain-containing protein [Pseudohongiellaceae bacterium]|jgi:prepilin-type N-terminal cleavage/methylation domain-containing protein
MKNQTGFTLLELLIVAAIAAAITGLIYASQLKKAKTTACISESSTVTNYAAVWAATITAQQPLGDTKACRAYKVAAEAWNGQCDDVLKPYNVPTACE